MLARCSSTRYANTKEEKMNMPDIDLFAWWALSISVSIVFITLISVYLYLGSKSKRKEGIQKKSSTLRMGKNFAFVLVLVALLIFYIFSIQLARTTSGGALSEAVFAAGNIIVEALLVLYLLRNRKDEPP
jgi:uncharacterized membrane protein